MNAVLEALSYLVARLSSMSFTRKGLFDGATFAAVLVFCLVLEYRKNGSIRRYGSKAVRTDLIYSFLYLSGIYSLFVSLPVYRFLTVHLSRWIPFARTHALAHVPAPLQFLCGLAVADLTYYCWHRTVHAVPVLWAFHSVHHSQREMTIATSLRVHIFEEMVRGLFYFVPAFVLQIPVTVWLPLDIAINWLLFLEHSDLDWTFGVFGKVIVSPHFHRVHHSVELQDIDTNFGSFLSIWDRVFGTANLRATRPAAYGVPGDPVPESFVRQLPYPFLALMRDRRPRAIVPLPAAAPVTD